MVELSKFFYNIIACLCDNNLFIFITFINAYIQTYFFCACHMQKQEVAACACDVSSCTFHFLSFLFSIYMFPLLFSISMKMHLHIHTYILTYIHTYVHQHNCRNICFSSFCSVFLFELLTFTIAYCIRTIKTYKHVHICLQVAFLGSLKIFNWTAFPRNKLTTIKSTPQLHCKCYKFIRVYVQK